MPIHTPLQLTGGLVPGGAIWILALTAAAGCGPRPPIETPAPADIETSLFLIGDAGDLDPRDVGVPLAPLTEQASVAPEKAIVIFLGDNVCPDGIPDEDHGQWADARRRLEAQIAAVPPGVRGIFVPGNHDWAGMTAFGFASIRIQENMIASLAGGRDVRLLPGNGCPGPVPVDAGRLRLIVVDTQWWLHDYIMRDAESDCTRDTGTVTRELCRQIASESDDRVVVVAGHHPLMTEGEHGGYCEMTGPFHRFGGRSQDITSSANRRMRDSLESAFAARPPLAYAAGHEHNLQVISGGASVGYILVSGAGSQSSVSCAVKLRESHFVSQHRSGFMRLDFLRGGGVLLRIFDYDGRSQGGDHVLSLAGAAMSMDHRPRLARGGAHPGIVALALAVVMPAPWPLHA